MKDARQADLEPHVAPLHHYLYPGGIFADARPHQVTTVLGSCVAVCLWDRVRGIGGINHYMLPLRNGEGLASPRYGNIAIPRLIERMEQLGCREADLAGKVFGGASMWQNVTQQVGIGEQNIAQAVQLLKERKIQILSLDVGGTTGRKIVFNTQTGVVMLRRLAGRDLPGQRP